jgi:GTP-binding protein HflX
MGDIMVFTDTVGFVYDIPHEIIEAFLSTLEETVFSDSILMLIDISDSYEIIKMKLHTTFLVLSRIGALNIPIIYIFNKIDKLDIVDLQEKKRNIFGLIPKKAARFFISAKEKDSVMNIIKMIRMMKKKTIIVNSSEFFAQSLIRSEEMEIDPSINKVKL